MPRLQIPEKLKPLLNPKRYKIIIGGRGSGKSTSVADLCLKDSQTEGMRIGCFREFQNSIDDSVHSLLESEIIRLQLQGFNVLKNEITNAQGGMFRYRGLARNIMSIQSMAGYKRFWVEEAHTLSKESIKVLTPTIREEGSEIWMTANPQSRNDPFSQRFIVPYEKQLDTDGFYEDDLHLIIVVNYCDNPWFPEVLEQERQNDKEILSTAEYEHIWLGKYNDEIENAIIPQDWFDACVDAHVKLGFKPRGHRIVSHDPADSGDAKALCDRYGSVIMQCLETQEGDVNSACDWAIDYALENDADAFTWDADGLGLSLKRQVDLALDGKKIDYYMFRGSEGVDNPKAIYQKGVNENSKARSNKDTFRNCRAQYYWNLRDRCYNTYLAVEKGQYKDPDELISFSSEIENLPGLRAEICRIPRKPNGSGLIQILSKDEMIRPPLRLKSPNRADCVMMSLKTPAKSSDWSKPLVVNAGRRV